MLVEPFTSVTCYLKVEVVRKIYVGNSGTGWNRNDPLLPKYYVVFFLLTSSRTRFSNSGLLNKTYKAPPASNSTFHTLPPACPAAYPKTNKLHHDEKSFCITQRLLNIEKQIILS